MSETVPNLDFSIDGPPIMDDSCYYCGAPIRERHIKIQFEHHRKMRLHLSPCWETFVEGVGLIDDALAARNNN